MDRYSQKRDRSAMHRGVGVMALLTHVQLSLEFFHDDFQEVKEEYFWTFMAGILGNQFFLFVVVVVFYNVHTGLSASRGKIKQQ